MVFKFRIVSDEVPSFKREIDIDATSTFLDLKNAICESVGYDKNQMCSFFLCNEDWEKEKEITLEDMDVESDQDVFLMEECELGDYLDDEGEKLIFVFDYMTDRCFFMELRDIITHKDLREPLCTLSVGKAPAQMVDFDEFTKDIDEKAATNATRPVSVDDLDEEFYGSDEYDPSEFDEEGFDQLELE